MFAKKLKKMHSQNLCEAFQRLIHALRSRDANFLGLNVFKHQHIILHLMKKLRGQKSEIKEIRFICEGFVKGRFVPLARRRIQSTRAYILGGLVASSAKMRYFFINALLAVLVDQGQ